MTKYRPTLNDEAKMKGKHKKRSVVRDLGEKESSVQSVRRAGWY
jgi:hypothetical protein